jgi:RHH-type rel operon transcriptional repressor/antitoxin RelB
MATVSVSFRTEPTTVEKLDEFARTSRRDRTQLINEALAQYIDLQERNLRKIDEGIRAADAGDFATDDEVAAEFAKWRSL